MTSSNPQTLNEKWHAYMDAPSAQALDDMLHENCIFVSPVVFTPQKGKALTLQYLLAAGHVFDDRHFDYKKETITDDRMILEFEAEIDGKYINGVDIIDFDADGLITEFKVMVRPLQAVHMLWEKMGAQLDAAKQA